MKKVKKISLLLALVASLASCNNNNGGTSSGKTFYTVDFNSLGQIVQTVSVEKGKRITEEIKTPTAPDASYNFRGWYKDEKALNEWKFDVDTVKNNLTLYAGWTIITSVPSDIKTGEAAFSSDITWLQGGFSLATPVTVKLYDYVSTSEDGKNTYSETGNEIAGTVSYDSKESRVTFTPTTIPAGGMYKVGVKSGDSDEVFAEDVFLKGDGSQTNPYLIVNGSDFDNISKSEEQKTVGTNSFYKLYQDVSVESDYTTEMNVTFDGTLLGNGKTITVTGNCAAIGKIGEHGVVSNVIVAGNVSTGSFAYIGALANTNNGKVETVLSTALVTSTAGLVADLSTEELGGAGGIVGLNDVKGTINNVTYEGNSGDSTTGVVKANIGGGGIVGTNKGVITNATNKGCLGAYNSTESGKSLSKYSYSGGIAGFNYGEISQSTTNGAGKILFQRAASDSDAVEFNNVGAGGIVGYNKSGAKVTTSYFEGIRIHADQAVGGIVGINAGEVSYCYSNGRYVSSISSRSYVAGRKEVGGIVGRLESTGTVTNCYNTANVFAYSDDAQAIATSATNSVYVSTNPDTNTAWSKSNSASPKTNSPVAPAGSNNVSVTSSVLEGTESASSLTASEVSTLGSEYEYITGDTVRLKWEGKVAEEVATIVVNYYDGEELVHTETIKDELGSSLTLYAYNKTGYTVNGWKLSADSETLYDKTQGFTYAELDALDTDGTVNFYADLTEVSEDKNALVVAYLPAYFTEQTLENMKTAYSKYCETNNIVIEDLVFRAYNQKAVADYTTSIATDGDVDIILGVGNNINTAAQSAVKDYVISKAEINLNNTSRYYATLSLGGNTDNLETFVTFLGTDEANKALNPAVSTDVLRIAVYGKYVPAEIVTNLEAGFKAYLESQGITISKLEIVTLGDGSTKVAAFVDLVLADETGYDCVLGGGKTIGSTEGSNGTKLDVTNTTLNINNSERMLSTINSSENKINVNTFIEYCLSDAGQAILNPTAAE